MSDEMRVIKANLQGCILEIIDASVVRGERNPLLPHRIKINGQEVGLLCEDGIELARFRYQEPHVVILKLLPAETIIRAAEPGEFDLDE